MRSAARAESEARARLHARLQERRGEIEEAVLTRIYAISDPTTVGDPGYVEGLRTTVAAAVDYGFGAVESGGRVSPLPVAVFSQTRLAARSAIGLDTVLRRYFAGYSLLSGFLVEEAGEVDLSRQDLGSILAEQASIFDHLLVAISTEYAREADNRPESPAQRRLELVKRLLAGDRIDQVDLEYDLDARHLGLVASGSGATDLLRAMGNLLDQRLLLVTPDENTAWAWLGGRRPPDPAKAHSVISAEGLDNAYVAIGEVAEGYAGWRLTHRQAAAALPIARRGAQHAVRYGDVALQATAMQDDLLVSSLQQLYLRPLERERGGKVLRTTLRAYLRTQGNVTSTAAALGVTRKTVVSRLRRVERHLGRPVDTSSAELRLALDLWNLKGDPVASWPVAPA